MKVLAAVCLTLAGCLPAAAAGIILPGHVAHLGAAWFGCPSADDMNRMLDLYVQHDIDASIRYAMAHACVMLDANVGGTVEHASVWSHLTCLRPKGEPDCLWLPNAVLEEGQP